MICNSIIPGLQWSSQGHSFSVDAGVLPLKCYDMILGQDWLSVGALEEEGHEVHIPEEENYS